MDLARSIWVLLGVLILNCLRQWCFKRMLSWIVVRQKQLVESLKWTLWTDHGSVLLMVSGAGLSQESLTPMGWISICTLEAENVPVLAGMNLLEKHDISFRRNEFSVYDAEGHTRSVPLRRSASGHRILNLLLQKQRAAS